MVSFNLHRNQGTAFLLGPIDRNTAFVSQVPDLKAQYSGGV